jgi:hypothetical protein
VQSYSWNTAKVGIKHQSINQSSVLCNHIAEILLKLALNTNQLINQMFCYFLSQMSLMLKTVLPVWCVGVSIHIKW